MQFNKDSSTNTPVSYINVLLFKSFLMQFIKLKILLLILQKALNIYDYLSNFYAILIKIVLLILQ